MSDYRDIGVAADTPELFVSAYLRIMPLVPKDVRQRLKFIMAAVSCSKGDHAFFERFNGCTVGQILASASDIPDSQAISTGEVGGLSYQVFEKPSRADDKPGYSS
jgi:hypothetical protein